MDKTSRCRVVALEWDRGHETFDAIVRAESDAGVVCTEVIDLASTPGLAWIRGNEITDLVDLDEDLGVVQLADTRAERDVVVDVSSTQLLVLLERFAADGTLVAVYRECTGSDSCLVGEVIDPTEDEFHLRLVDGRGRYDNDPPFEYRTNEVIRLDWGTTYLGSLGELLAAG